jgi:hypothetical protein
VTEAALASASGSKSPTTLHPSTDPAAVVPGAMAALTNPIFLGRR